MKIGDSHAATTTVAYDPEGKTLAVGKYFFFLIFTSTFENYIGSFDGSIKLFSPFTGKQT